MQKARINTNALIVIIILIASLVGCEESVDPPVDTEMYPDLGLSLEDSLEAEVIAYFLDQTLTASDSSLKRELYLLNYLRQTYLDTFPFLDDWRFAPSWMENQIVVGADTSILRQIKDHTFQNWGDMPMDMRPDSVGRINSFGSAICFLNPGYHPVLLSEHYEQVPGIEYAEENALGWFDRPFLPVAINQSDSGNVYLFSVWEGVQSPRPFEHYLFNYVENQPNYLGQSAELSNSEYGAFINRFLNHGFP